MTDFQAIQQKYYECGFIFDEISSDYVKALEEREEKMLNFIALLSEYEITDTCISDFIREITGQSIEEVLRK